MSSTESHNFFPFVILFRKYCTFYLFILTSFYLTAESKIMEKCDIAIQLDESEMNSNLAEQWICIAEELSKFNSSATKRVLSFQNNESDPDPCQQYTLGLFQISNDWCNSPDDKEFGSCKRNGCVMDCFKLLDDDITDDIECIKSIHDLDGFRMWPQITVSACRRSRKLRSSTDWNITECLLSKDERQKQRNLTFIPLWGALLIVALSSLAVFTLTYFFYRYRRNSVTILSPSEMKEFRYGRMSSISIRPPLSTPRLSEFIRESCVDQPYNVDFEVAPTEFSIDYTNCLGSGAYGIVYKAMLKGKTVAVKTVKQNATRAYLQSLLGEIKILCHIGRHDFIVNLEAAYTKNLQRGTLYVFMEYCALGSLEKYLRSNRNNYLSLEEIQDPVELKNNTENSTELPVQMNLTFKNLLQYAHQVAKGMEFLASKQVIHGDLAARNILLTHRNFAKISDFGLSRKLYGYIQYTKTKEEPLPWRYMAPESLRENNFSTASDVWMYGVLLFEIFSLGEIPFAGMSWTLDFVDKLENGFRMLKPKHAPEDVYKNKMLKCWEASPLQRPSFFELSNYFHQALHIITAKEYTELVVADTPIFQTENENDDED